MKSPLRVAVIGAGRIGKQHAKWFQAAGCRVVGFLGSTPESVAAARTALAGVLGTDVPGFTELPRLVEETGAVAATICSPHARHAEHALAAIGAGLHVLCEKPLVWDESKSAAAMLVDARRVGDAAKDKGVKLGMMAQYISGIPPYRRWYEEAQGRWEPARRFESVMQSRGRAGGAEYEQIWIDLASHSLSLLLKLVPGAYADPRSLHCLVRRKEVRAEFTCTAADGTPTECLIRLNNVPDGPICRRFGVNDFLLDYEGRNNAEGVYRAFLSRDGASREYPDFMETAIRGFVQAVETDGDIPVPFEEAFRNLEMQLAILDRAVVERE